MNFVDRIKETHRKITVTSLFYFRFSRVKQTRNTCSWQYTHTHVISTQLKKIFDASLVSLHVQ